MQFRRCCRHRGLRADYATWGYAVGRGDAARRNRFAIAMGGVLRPGRPRSCGRASGTVRFRRAQRASGTAVTVGRGRDWPCPGLIAECVHPSQTACARCYHGTMESAQAIERERNYGSAGDTAQGVSDGLPKRQRTIVLAVMMSGTTAACISQSMMIAALPTIMHEYSVSARSPASHHVLHLHAWPHLGYDRLSGASR